MDLEIISENGYQFYIQLQVVSQFCVIILTIFQIIKRFFDKDG